MFDPQSQLSPASLGPLQTGAGSFTLQGDFRSVDTPAGSARTRDYRFPNVFITAPIRRGHYAFGVGATTYLNRDFTLAVRDSIVLRDSVRAYTDTTSSRGGLSDLQLAFAIRTIPKTTVGFAFHLITGTDRLVARRAFDDTSYAAVLQSAELSTTGFGLAIGATRDLSSKVTLAALIRKDFTASVNVDSALLRRGNRPRRRLWPAVDLRRRRPLPRHAAPAGGDAGRVSHLVVGQPGHGEPGCAGREEHAWN